MALPVLREFGVGYTFWQVVIGRDMFNSAAGLIYPDGTVRRIEQIEAVLDAPADGFVEKPDEEGVPLGDNLPVRLWEYLDASVEDGVTDVTWRERHTQVEALLSLPHVFGDDAQSVRAQLVEARKVYQAGNKDDAFATIATLLRKARDAIRATSSAFVPAKRPKATVYRDAAAFFKKHIHVPPQPIEEKSFVLGSVAWCSSSLFLALPSIFDWPARMKTLTVFSSSAARAGVTMASDMTNSTMTAGSSACVFMADAPRVSSLKEGRQSVPR